MQIPNGAVDSRSESSSKQVTMPTCEDICKQQQITNRKSIDIIIRELRLWRLFGERESRAKAVLAAAEAID